MMMMIEFMLLKHWSGKTVMIVGLVMFDFP